MMNSGREERQRSCGIIAVNHAECTYMHTHTHIELWKDHDTTL